MRYPRTDSLDVAPSNDTTVVLGTTFTREIDEDVRNAARAKETESMRKLNRAGPDYDWRLRRSADG